MALFVLSLLLIISFLMVCCETQFLQVGFYSNKCPQAESIVHDVVRKAVRSDHNMAAGLLRLHFHDCFVEGCDGSILIDNGPNSEKNAFGHQGLRGFDVIDIAKSQLEAVCPGVVSCADIVALAARDAIAMANGPTYQVQTGRRDGLVSNVSLADNMPDVSDSIGILNAKFLNKGLTQKDLVLLSGGAHTIGTTACFFMTKRLYHFRDGSGSDPSINPNFLQQLKARCPEGGDINNRIAIDVGGEFKFDKHILNNIRQGFAVLESDARLNDDIVTKSIMDSYFNNNPFFGPSFEADFVDSIVRMGQLGVKTGLFGDIRRVCNKFN